MMNVLMGEAMNERRPKKDSEKLLLDRIERIYFNLFIRRYSVEQFAKSFDKIGKEDVTNIHWKLIKRIRHAMSYGRRVSDDDLLQTLVLFRVTVKSYFDRLDELLMGELIKRYDYDKTKVGDDILSNYIEMKVELLND